jgi:hypothetical protein
LRSFFDDAIKVRFRGRHVALIGTGGGAKAVAFRGVRGHLNDLLGDGIQATPILSLHRESGEGAPTFRQIRLQLHCFAPFGFGFIAIRFLLIRETQL